MASPGPTAVAQPAAKSAASPFPWIPFLWFTVLLCIPYAAILNDMVREWFVSEDMGHGLFVPIVCGYIVWSNRQNLFSSVPAKPNWWGLLLVAWGFFQAVLGILGADFFIARTAFIVALIGVIITLGGLRTVRKLAFPLFLLLFMIRIPLFIYSQITFPLQIFASQLAAGALSMLGIPVMREGNVLELASQKLSVVEACSGIRSLISLSFMALVYAYFCDRKVWMRSVLLVLSIPIAILCNASRITLTGIMSEYNKDLAGGVYHSFEGWVMFMVALVVLIVVHQIINRLYSLFHARKTQLSS
jgi:exosortase